MLGVAFCGVMRRRISCVLIVQFGCTKPTCRTFMKPGGRTCWRNLRIHSITARRKVRGRLEPGFREVKVTMRSLRPTSRRLEMATLKTYGARYLRAVEPSWLACYVPCSVPTIDCDVYRNGGRR